jgi:hypothetical protein
LALCIHDTIVAISDHENQLVFTMSCILISLHEYLLEFSTVLYNYNNTSYIVCHSFYFPNTIAIIIVHYNIALKNTVTVTVWELALCKRAKSLSMANSLSNLKPVCIISKPCWGDHKNIIMLPYKLSVSDTFDALSWLKGVYTSLRPKLRFPFALFTNTCDISYWHIW